jgi:hypothetical protein
MILCVTPPDEIIVPSAAPFPSMIRRSHVPDRSDYEFDPSPEMIRIQVDGGS